MPVPYCWALFSSSFCLQLVNVPCVMLPRALPTWPPVWRLSSAEGAPAQSVHALVFAQPLSPLCSCTLVCVAWRFALRGALQVQGCPLQEGRAGFCPRTQAPPALSIIEGAFQGEQQAASPGGTSRWCRGGAARGGGGGAGRLSAAQQKLQSQVCSLGEPMTEALLSCCCADACKHSVPSCRCRAGGRRLFLI